jgi:hypothetical protein
MNMFGSSRRIEIALGRHPEEIGRELIDLVSSSIRHPRETLGHARPPRRARASLRPARVSSAPVQEVVEYHDSTGCRTCGAGRGTAGHSSPSARHSPEPPHPCAQLRPLPAAGLRSGDHRDALAEHEGGRGHHFEAERLHLPLEAARGLGGDPSPC